MSNRNIFITNDKAYAPFLLVCSYHRLVSFVDDYAKEGVAYFEFSPEEKAKNLIKMYEVKQPLNIPEKDVIEATNVFWRKVYDAKN